MARIIVRCRAVSSGYVALGEAAQQVSEGGIAAPASAVSLETATACKIHAEGNVRRSKSWCNAAPLSFPLRGAASRP